MVSGHLARKLSYSNPAGADFLCDEAAMFEDMMKGTESKASRPTVSHHMAPCSVLKECIATGT
jgi:hypothetical protein